MADLAPGIQEINSLRQAGFTASEIDQWQADTRGQLEGAGFTTQEVEDYFGVKNPDMEPVKAKFQENLNTKMAAKTEAAPAVQEPVNPALPQQKEADSFLEAIEAGFDMSVTGLIANGRPDVVMAENAPMFYRIASQVGTLAGDVPAMLAGAIAGAPAGAAAFGAAGSVVPVAGTAAGVAAGTVIGAGAGAFALPEGMRTALMDHYEKGDINSFSDFWERTSAVAINSLKAGVIGGATAGVGGVVGKVAAKAAIPAAAKTTAQLTSEVLTMTTVGAALDGKVPEPHEFLDAAILVGGMHGAIRAGSKIRRMYGKGNVTPAQVAEVAAQNPKLKQEILSSNVEVPGRGEFGIEAFHGTFETFAAEALRPSKGGRYGEGFYLTLDKGQAGNYGNKVLEYNVRNSNLIDMSGQGVTPKIAEFAQKHGLDLSKVEGKPGEQIYGRMLSEIRNKFPDENLVGTNANKKLQGMLKAEGIEGIQFEQNGVSNVVLFDRASFKTIQEMALKDEPQFSTSKPLREPNPNLSPEVNTILGKVAEKAEGPGKLQAAKESVQELTSSKMYTALVDKLDPINQATKILSEAKELPAENNPYILARLSVDHKAKAKHFFENGTLDFKTKEVTGKSLRDTLSQVESIETLEAYMISKRAIEKHGQGFKTGFDIPAAEAVVKQNAAKYEQAAREVTEFSNRTLDYVAQSGVISEKTLARMKEANKDYVPFKRVMEANEKGQAARAGGKAGSLKEYKGSERAIQSPITSILENTIELIKMAEINRPKQELVKLAAKTEGQELIKSVPDRMKPIEVKASEIIAGLEAQGAVTLESIRKDLKERGIKLTDEQLVKAFEKESGVLQTEQIRDITIWRKEQMDLAPNQFAVYEQGKRKVFETTPEIAEALKKLDGDVTASNMFFKIANGITTVKKFGITFTPDFIFRNFARDLLTASTFSKSKGMSPFDVIGAVGDIWKKNSTYYEWLKSGGANGAFIEMGNRYVKTDIYKLQRETNFMGSVRNLIEKPVEVMRVAAELSEQSLRVAEFKKTRKAGGSLDAAGFASREITIDFQRVGAKISALNAITAFMNVSIQGLDRSARAFKENPTATATKSMAYITAPSVLLWWANHDDPRYQEIPRWEKDLFWIIPTDDWQDSTPEEADGLPEYMVRESGGKFQVNKGTIYRLPKPQELGIIFGSLPERTLEAFFGENPGAYKNFDETLISLVTPSMVPDAVAPAIEQYFNKSFFTGRDIVPAHLKDVLPEYQFVEYTSETAKTLGKLVATVDQDNDFASPMILQNYIRSWGGSLGQYAVQLADKALIGAGIAGEKVNPDYTMADVPFIKSFVVRFPMAGSQSVQDFQDNYRESKRIFDTIRHLGKEGDLDSFEKLLVANQDTLLKLDGIQEALSTQSNFIRLVHKNPDMTPDEKRQMIDGAYLQMTEVAKVGNQLVSEIKKQVDDTEQVGE